MISQTERLKRLNQMLVERRDICCSEGSVDAFPVLYYKKHSRWIPWADSL